MTDQLHIRDLTVSAIIGVYPRERITRQPLAVDITLVADMSPAVSDKLEDAIDYVAIVNLVKQAAAEQAFGLIEAFADYLCTAILAHDARIELITLTLAKPGAIRDASVAVTLTRQAPK